jgi:integrase
LLYYFKYFVYKLIGKEKILRINSVFAWHQFLGRRPYTDDECDRLVRAASELKKPDCLEWDLAIITALTTAMRKSEILNLVWSDIDFDEMTITIVEKYNTDETWEWRIKDKDHRTVPLTKELAELLISLQSRSPIGYPYVFVPTIRYDKIQQIRKGITSIRGKKTWTYTDARISIIRTYPKTLVFGIISAINGLYWGFWDDF